MKCPNKNCGPWKTPELLDAGYGLLKRCPICRNYYNRDGEKVDNPVDYNNVSRSNGWSFDEDEDMEGMFNF